jgi:dephospho-CoA kinase
VYELALEKRGPLTDAEKNEARKAARDAKRAIADAVTAAQAVVDATDF